MKHRRRSGYSKAVNDWIAMRQWEYVSLETLPANEATEAEAWWIGYLRSYGCHLANDKEPSPPRPTPKQPPGPRGSGDTPSDEYLKERYDRLHIRLPKGYADRLRCVSEARCESLTQWVMRHVGIDEG